MAIRVNGETVLVADSLLQQTTTAVSMEIAGQDTAELFLTAKATSGNPSGRYRIRIVDDVLHIQRSTSTTPEPGQWASARDLMTISPSGVVASAGIDLSSLEVNLATLVLGSANLDEPDVLWLGEGNGPSALPYGYLVVLVDGRPVYIPYWL